jgi:tripartite-type tricarboxylate transporter receptor subunit TctC
MSFNKILPFILVASLLWQHPAVVFAQAFYKGKTITLLQGRDAAGTGVLYAKTVMPFLQKYIPGNPHIVPEFMPGAGGRTAANHIFRTVRPDGLTIGSAGAGVVSLAVLGESGISYDIDKFIYLGSTYSTANPLFITRKEAGLDTIDKLRAFSGLRIGDQSVGFSTYNEGRLFAYLLDLKGPKFVVGYSRAEADLAMLGGEVDARTTLATTVLGRNREWIERNLVNVHAVINVPQGEKHPHFAQVPDLDIFAKSDIERRVITLLRVFRLVGAPFFLPPGTPKDRVEILREAMRKTFEDPEFHKEYKKLLRDEPTPLMPEAQEEAIKKIPRQPDVIALLKKIVGAGPLPRR